MEDNTYLVCSKLIKENSIYAGLTVYTDFDPKNVLADTEKTFRAILSTKKDLIKESEGKIMFLYNHDHSKGQIKEITTAINTLEKRFYIKFQNLFLGHKIKFEYAHTKDFLLSVERTGFEEVQMVYRYKDATRPPQKNYRTSENIQEKNERSHIINYELFPPISDAISKVYEKFVLLDDLKEMPTEKWINETRAVIQQLDQNEYIEHLEYTFGKLISFQQAHNEAEIKIKEAKKKGKFKTIRDVVDSDGYQEAPTHFYFYSSAKGKYLKGLIHSVKIERNDSILNLLLQFAIDCPFQTKGASQAPTGLYVYDILDVFKYLDLPDSVNYIFQLKNNITQTWAQRRFEKTLKEIAEEQEMTYQSLLDKYIIE